MKSLAKALILSLLISVLISSCGGQTPPKEVGFVLTTGLQNGKLVFIGVGSNIEGVANPDLRVGPGEVVTLTLINGEGAEHDIFFPDFDAKTSRVSGQGNSVSVTFTAPERSGSYLYMDTVPGHAEAGMKGYLLVGEAQAPETESPAVMGSETTEGSESEAILAAFQKGGCSACHVIPGIPNAVGTIGPDLTEIATTASEQMQSSEYTGAAQSADEYIRESLVDPNIFVAPICPSGPCPSGLMPSTLKDTLSESELSAIVDYLSGLPESATRLAEGGTAETAALGDAPELTEEEFGWAKQTFFERCAGCHGTLRKGATGPALTPDVTLPKGTLALASIIFNGTPRGMPDWGKQGFMTEEQTDIMARFLQNEPPAPPEMSLEQMQASWKLIVPPDQRPTSPQTTRDWQNYFVVTLRDAGQVAIIDGDTYEVITTVDTGYAVHITRMSATGRYAYVIGRDGKLALVDLWMEIPEKVAEAQLCYDARSVEVSKYEGVEGDFTDKYAIVGCYWPPHFVILDGQTLEPFKVVSTRSYTYDTGEYHSEPRVASIVASHFKPEWIVNVKETGQVWLVNYADPRNPTITMIEAERFLHDGGWDSTKRYFLVAANQSNKIAVIDALEGDLEALVDSPAVPHPGRGANWIDPEFGPVWSTPHLGEAAMLSISTDPEGHPDVAWTATRITPLPGSGSLFIKTHPKSKWIWVDFVLNSDPALSRTICVIAKSDPTKTYKCWEIGDYGRAVHMEYNKDGSEVWISLWGTADVPGQTGEIVIYNDETLEEIARIKDLITPTGKFNVYNTVNDVY
jgi:nitrite reductase (NO-forming)/hydroxylamine reductase